MRYTECIAASARALKAALPLMSRQRAALHPVSYAVWYEHAAQMNAALSRELMTLTEGGRRLDEAQTWSLYRRHIAELDEDSALHLARDVGQALHGVSDCAEQAGHQLQHYSRDLARWLDALTHAAPGQHTEVLAAAAQGTQDMQARVSSLTSRLALSRQEVARLRQELQRARSEALLDPLTGLGNRRAFEQALAECLRSPEAGTPVAPCLVLGVIDNAATLRDHMQADRLADVLNQVAQTARSVAQAHHVAVRLDDHTFAVMMPGAGLHEAHMLAEQWRHGAGQVAAQDGLRVSLSVGVTQLGRDDTVGTVLSRAQRALATACLQGPNRVTVLAADERFAA